MGKKAQDLNSTHYARASHGTQYEHFNTFGYTDMETYQQIKKKKTCLLQDKPRGL